MSYRTPKFSSLKTVRDPRNGKPHHEKEHTSTPQKTVPHPSTHKSPFPHISIRYSSNRTPPPFPTILYPRIKQTLAGKWQTSRNTCQKKHDREWSVAQTTQAMKKRGEIGFTRKPYQTGKIVGQSKILTEKKTRLRQDCQRVPSASSPTCD